MSISGLVCKLQPQKASSAACQLLEMAVVLAGELKVEFSKALGTEI